MKPSTLKRSSDAAPDRARNFEFFPEAPNFDYLRSGIEPAVKKKRFKLDPSIPGEKYGPDPKQKLLWIERMTKKIRKRFGHKCNWDIVLCLGASRSGKSLAAVARCIYLCCKYPGTKVIVGSLNFAQLEGSLVEDYKRLFSINKEWDHPFILRKPGRSHKRIVFRNGSSVSFINLGDNYMRVLGRGVDVIHIEEPELLKSEEAYMTLLTRLSGKATPIKQVILTANPTEDLGWMIKLFDLDQYQEDFEGVKKKPGKPCSCHICPKCQKATSKQIEYIDGVCPKCQYVKRVVCPGRQHNMRVIIFRKQNTHVDDTYQQKLEATLSHDHVQRFVKGFVLHKKKGKVYNCFHASNVYAEDKPVNLKKPLIWCLDFNNRPQCSVICQTLKRDGQTHIDVIDEITQFDAGPEQVADIFIKRYAKTGIKTVFVYCDPAGHNGAIKSLKLSTIAMIVQCLEQKGRFDVQLMTPRTKYPIADRFNAVNWNLRSGDDYVRLRFNPKCVHVISGLDQIKWNRTGDKEDETEDFKARERGKNGAFWPGLTHHAAAVGYFLVKEHPMIPYSKRDDPYFQIPATGEVVTISSDDTVRRTQFTAEKIAELERLYRSQEEYDDDDDDELDRREMSIAGMIRQGGGAWG